MKSLLTLTIALACTQAQAGKLPSCVPPMLAKILPAATVASMPGVAATKDAQIKQLCAELRAEVAALPPVK